MSRQGHNSSPVLVIAPEIGYSFSGKDMRKLFILAVIAFFLCSCIGVDSRLSIRADGSGTLDLTYRISQTVTDLGRSGTQKSPLPLPLTKADFDRGLSDVSGVRLTSFSRSENEADIMIHAVIAFDSVSALAQVTSFKDEAPALSVAGSGHTYSQVIVKAASEELSSDTLAMLDSLFSDYHLSFSVEAPAQIQSFSLGTLSQDKRTLSYSASVKELVTTTKDIVMSLSW
jgi:hypothetical protein